MEFAKLIETDSLGVCRINILAAGFFESLSIENQVSSRGQFWRVAIVLRPYNPVNYTSNSDLPFYAPWQ